MQFTRLRLNGFKSFVDPTDLVINQGLTGVVGPNGCGKSNLLEALRWVMGENRPTAMRGGGMEDVIFAGTTSRSARNFAEVSLVIDNADRLAPAGFNDHDAIEIVRRITRDAGSAYQAQGRDVRARDVQMLFADASTGAQSPALVRQGQIAELISAKPKARRRILEEAAGISGLYQRRHEAELKLKGAEANLLRVDDVIEQLAGQLAQLARQAKQAARYREIGTRLRQAEGLLLYRRWREADDARGRAEAVLADHVRAAAAAERGAREVAAAREAAEAALPSLREEDAIAGAVVQRLQVERAALAEQAARAEEGIASLAQRLEQIDRDAGREEVLNLDAGESIARLDAEAGELEAAGRGFDGGLAAAGEAAEEAGRVLSDREAALTRLTEDVARLSARHQSVGRALDDATKTKARAETAARQAREGVAEAGAALEATAEAQEAAAQAEAEATAGAARAEEALKAADGRRGAAQEAEAEARAVRSALDGELGALRAEHGALRKLVAREDGSDQLLDAVQVAPGYEAALGAALADDLRAPVVESGSGWQALPCYASDQPLPEGVEPLAAHVTVPEVLARRIAQVGLVEGAVSAELRRALGPGQRLVSRAGDLWRWDGFTAAAADAPSAAALRLQQRNRLDALSREVAALEARAGAAARDHAGHEARLAEATEADAAARKARRAADAAVAETGRALSRAAADRVLAEGRRETATLAVTRHEEEAREAAARLAEAEAAMADLSPMDAARAEVEDVRVTVEAARMTMMARRSAHDELRREGEARAKRQGAVAKELAGWRKRLESAGARLADLSDRRARTERELDEARAVPGRLSDERARIESGIGEAEARRERSAAALAEGEAALRRATEAERAAERAAGETREARAAAAAQSEAAGEAARAAAARIEDELEVTPAALLDTLGVEPEAMPSAERVEAEVAQLKRQREALGAVNLRAEDDAAEVEGEHDALVREKDDLEAAIGELRRGIAGLNREGRERLLTAFEQVNANFSMLFTHLFGGGEARLELVESDDPLDAGLEILCQPPGKRLQALSLLSGGEQTLTAMALIFAVFLANPAPICVLDEVDAPLDDANVTRFCDMLDEMTRRTETRFLIITHHAVTMARMDRLFGVTMGEQGVSQLVSVDLKKAEAMVA